VRKLTNTGMLRGSNGYTITDVETSVDITENCSYSTTNREQPIK